MPIATTKSNTENNKAPSAAELRELQNRYEAKTRSKNNRARATQSRLDAYSADRLVGVDLEHGLVNNFAGIVSMFSDMQAALAAASVDERNTWALQFIAAEAASKQLFV